MFYKIVYCIAANYLEGISSWLQIVCRRADLVFPDNAGAMKLGQI